MGPTDGGNAAASPANNASVARAIRSNGEKLVNRGRGLLNFINLSSLFYTVSRSKDMRIRIDMLQEAVQGANLYDKYINRLHLHVHREGQKASERKVA